MTNVQQPGARSRAEILSQPEAWRAVLRTIMDRRGALRAALDAGEEVLFTGCGSAYHIAMAAAAVFRAEGRAARALVASDMAMFTQQAFYDSRRRLVVLISRSGETTETLLALEELKLGIPDDIGIVTFDDVKWLQFLKCPISAIRQPAGEIGSVSLQLLVERIKNKKETKTRVILLEAALVERKSCGPPG
jgi:glucosamine--fructose-6-phosphate aminotransferase (isomerizing)